MPNNKRSRSPLPQESRKKQAVSVGGKPSASSSSANSSSTRMMQQQMSSALKPKKAPVSYEVEIDLSQDKLDDAIIILNKFMLHGDGARLKPLKDELSEVISSDLPDGDTENEKLQKGERLRKLLGHELDLLKKHSSTKQKASIRAIFSKENIIPFMGDRGDGKSFNNMSMVIGLKNDELGCEYRVDYDPKKGLHINLKMNNNKYAIKVSESSSRFNVSVGHAATQADLIKFKFWIKMTLGYYSTEREETLESRIRESYTGKESFNLKEELLGHIKDNYFEENIEETIQFLEGTETEAKLFDFILSDDDPHMNVIRNFTINYFTTLLSGKYFAMTLNKERNRTEVQRTNVGDLDDFAPMPTRRR